MSEREDICIALNDYAQKICPELKLNFQPHIGQPRVMSSRLVFDDLPAFNLTELNKAKFNTNEFEQLFENRVNGALQRIATESLNAIVDTSAEARDLVDIAKKGKREF